MKPQLSQRFQFSLAYLLVTVVVLGFLQAWLLAQQAPNHVLVEILIGSESQHGSRTLALTPGQQTLTYSVWRPARLNFLTHLTCLLLALL